ncbi:Uncharacterised protein [Enterobacter cloacae]|nr:Uncharacterised protein [Enterobacter cloacae]
MRPFEQCHHEGAVVAGEDTLFVITLFYQPVETFLLAAKDDAVRAYMSGKKGVHRLMIFAKLNAPLAVIEV